MKLSLVLAAMAPSPAGAVLPPAGDAGKVAYVTGDKVGDVERRYTLADQSEQQKASSPAGLLASMIERCRAPLRSGAILARSIRRGCGCGPYDIADKAERPYGD